MLGQGRIDVSIKSVVFDLSTFVFGVWFMIRFYAIAVQLRMYETKMLSDVVTFA